MSDEEKRELQELRDFQAELWGLTCPDAGPQDRQAILEKVGILVDRESKTSAQR